MERCWWVPASAGMTVDWAGRTGTGACPYAGSGVGGFPLPRNDGWAGRTGTGACPYAGMDDGWVPRGFPLPRE